MSKFPGNAFGLTISAGLVLLGLYMLNGSLWSIIGLGFALWTFFVAFEIMMDNKLNP